MIEIQEGDWVVRLEPSSTLLEGKAWRVTGTTGNGSWLALGGGGYWWTAYFRFASQAEVNSTPVSAGCIARSRTVNTSLHRLRYDPVFNSFWDHATPEEYREFIHRSNESVHSNADETVSYECNPPSVTVTGTTDTSSADVTFNNLEYGVIINDPMGAPVFMSDEQLEDSRDEMDTDIQIEKIHTILGDYENRLNGLESDPEVPELPQIYRCRFTKEGRYVRVKGDWTDDHGRGWYSNGCCPAESPHTQGVKVIFPESLEPCDDVVERDHVTEERKAWQAGKEHANAPAAWKRGYRVGMSATGLSLSLAAMLGGCICTLIAAACR